MKMALFGTPDCSYSVRKRANSVSVNRTMQQWLALSFFRGLPTCLFVILLWILMVCNSLLGNIECVKHNRIPLESICDKTDYQNNENFYSRTPTSEVFCPLQEQGF